MNVFDESNYFVDDEPVTVTETVTTPKKVLRTEDRNKMEVMNTSNKIRFLNDFGYTRSEISKLLGVRYQHVRGVLTTPLKKKIG